MDEHRKYIRKVLIRLQKAGLHVNIKKTEFYRTEVRYLGIIISTKGLKIKPKKVNAIRKQKTSKNIYDVLLFLGFTNFYRYFIKDFERITLLLTELTKGKKKEKQEDSTLLKKTQTKPIFYQTLDAQRSFKRLRKAFSTDIVLAYFDYNRVTVIEVNALDYIVARVLSQYDIEGTL